MIVRMWTPLWFMGMVLGVALATGLIWGLTFVTPARAKPFAGLGYGISAVWLTIWVPATFSPYFEIGSLVQQTLLGALTAGLLLSIPRFLRWREKPWISLGVGLLIPNALALGAVALNYGLHYGLRVDANAVTAGAFSQALPWVLSIVGVAAGLQAVRARRRASAKSPQS